jgi:hypothetical protein
VSAKAKTTTPAHSTTVTHGNTRTTVTKHGNTTTTTRSVKHGNHRTTTTTVKRGGKVIRSSKSVAMITKAKATGAKAKARSTKRGAPGLCAEGFWVTGGNDWLATCVPVALANSCLITTGYRIPDWQILALAGERPIEDVLRELGMAYREADGLADGVILGTGGLHAVTVHDGAAVSWGAEVSLDELGIEEAWEVAWL